MTTETSLCMGCMNEKKYEGDCLTCGYSDKAAYMSSYLAPKTLLKNRYIVGKLTYYNGEAANYIGFDNETNEKVTIKEFMPDALCSRDKNIPAIKVPAEHIALYKTYLSEFAELNKSLMNAGELSRVQRVRDIFTENNTVYTVFDHVCGLPLKTYLSNLGGTMTWEQVKELFPPILTTLSQLHAIGIVHRGISPSTIYVSDKSELRLLGFGISAARTAESELSCEVFGGYAAPEQYSTNERNGSWTDVYGISAVLYRVLTGQNPPDAQARLEKDSLVEPMLVNRNIPNHVSAIIYKGMALRLEDRIPTINEFVDRLFEQPTRAIENSAELYIAKPLKERKPDSAGKPAAKPAAKSVRKKKKSNAPAIAALVFIILLVLGFAAAIIITSLTQKPAEEKSDVTTSAVTTAMETTEAAPKTAAEISETEQTAADIAAEPETTYKMPNLVNRPYDLIKDNTKYSFLTILTEYEFNSDFAAGTVFEQSIKEDSMVAAGTEITVKISKGPGVVPLPDYAGMTLNDYCTLLSASNIKYERKGITDKEVKSGNVVKCSVEVGAPVNVEEGDTITIYYCKKKDSAETTAKSDED